MEQPKREVLSMKDKILTLMFSFGLILIMAGAFSLLLILFYSPVTIWPKSLATVLMGIAIVGVSVTLEGAGQKK